MANERRLRSKAEVRKQNPTLFNFEKINKVLYRDQNIRVVSATDFQNLYKEVPTSSPTPAATPTPVPPSLGSTAKPAAALTSKTAATSSSANASSQRLRIRDDLLPRRSKGKLVHDPLSNSHYDVFHKRMKKEEKKMSNIDRQRILNEVDTLTTSLQLLQQYDWIKHIQGITQIYDPHNHKDLEYKRVLTIYEIKRLLKKYESWKKREDALNTDIKAHHKKLERDTQHGSSAAAAAAAVPAENSIESEYNLPIDQLRARRQSERCKKHGQIIRLKLTNGLSLIIDPLFPPKFIQSADSSASVSSAVSSDVSKTVSPVPGPANGAASSTSLASPSIGIKIPNITAHPFTISPSWKNERNHERHAAQRETLH